MDEIDRQHVAPSRHLNLYADTDVARPSVYRLLFDPIYAA